MLQKLSTFTFESLSRKCVCVLWFDYSHAMMGNVIGIVVHITPAVVNMAIIAPCANAVFCRAIGHNKRCECGNHNRYTSFDGVGAMNMENQTERDVRKGTMWATSHTSISGLALAAILCVHQSLHHVAMTWTLNRRRFAIVVRLYCIAT